MAASKKLDFKVKLTLFILGTAYVKYFNQEAATKAALLLNTCEIQPGYPVMIKVSFDINKLLMTMIPKHVPYKQVVQEVSTRVGFGLISVRPSSDEKENNEDKSYSVMLIYETHKHAMQARKLLSPGIRLWNTFVLVDWAPQQEPKLVSISKSRFGIFTTKSFLNKNRYVEFCLVVTETN